MKLIEYFQIVYKHYQMQLITFNINKYIHSIVLEEYFQIISVMIQPNDISI